MIRARARLAAHATVGLTFLTAAVTLAHGPYWLLFLVAAATAFLSLRRAIAIGQSIRTERRARPTEYR
jgi:hypothetical protein